ncbi:MAG: 8-amino-7-oxononanoate synthase [Phycisphaerae bacterium]|nr:8-amino-7-oxononanoate synthase [Phycisphaerae bacterium]
MRTNLAERLQTALNTRHASNRFRCRTIYRSIDSTHVEVNGRSLINFAGNDYLGLAHHPELRAHAAENGLPNGSGASGLVTGYSPAHASAEAAIARWKSTESAVLLPSGYQANHAAVQTFAALAGQRSESVRFLIDKLAHASLIDAVRGSGCPFRVFPHNQLTKLARLLESVDREQLQVVVTESIFSMDGDAADLAGLAAIRENHDFALLLDEAHGSGVYGDSGAGLAAAMNLSNLVDVHICTFSKAAGLVGGAVCASKAFCDGVVNFGRAYIFSTAIPPLLATQIERSIELMRREPWRQKRLMELAHRVRNHLAGAGWPLLPGDSPIIPLVVENENRALALAERLKSEGILTVAIRPPTVAPNSSRIRVTISSDHTDAQIDGLLSALGDYTAV